MFKDRMALWEQLFPPQQLSYTLTPSQLWLKMREVSDNIEES
jgi:hypothetical protein